MTTETVEKKELSIEEMIALVEKAYPEKFNHVRRVPHLFDNFFRVNYFNLGDQNKIDESHFVEVLGEEVKERKG